MNKIITVSREFGSSGRELGRRLSEQLNIADYDQAIISEISKRTELAEWYVEQIIEQNRLLHFPFILGEVFTHYGIQYLICSKPFFWNNTTL